ncbi:MAG: hypothetical protein D6731_24510 [Planctomycetota bacterium]|nr:MAG: hypothetical protein D6731_24510 [Planctomycetota bacterium]
MPLGFPAVPSRSLVPLFGLCDPFAALSHGAMGLLVFAHAAWLLRRSGARGLGRAALWAYVLGVGSMFLFSALYHALPPGEPLKDLFWRLDHASIWLGLATLHTPVQVLGGRPPDHRRRLLPIWTLACLGSGLETLCLDGLPAFVSPLLYVGMGWACFPILWGLRALPAGRFFWPLLLAGGGATVGGVVDALEAPVLWPGVFEAHEVVHLATALGGLVYGAAIAALAGGAYAAVGEGAEAASGEGLALA